MIDEDLLSAATDAADQTLQFCDTVKWLGLSSLKCQLQRSAISVASNIAEGIGRDQSRKKFHSMRGKVRFYLIAFGSLRECSIQLELLKRQRSELIGEISRLTGLWERVKNGMLFVIDGHSDEVHSPDGEHNYQKYVGLRKLNFERAAIVAIRRSLFEFLAHVKTTEDIRLLKSSPLRIGRSTYFSLETFRRFLEKHGRRVRYGELTGELKVLGWNNKTCRFGEKTLRVWLKSSVRNKTSFASIHSSQEKISEASGG